METVISFNVKAIDNGYLVKTKFSDWALHDDHVIHMDDKVVFCHDYEEVGDFIAAEMEELTMKVREADAETFSKVTAEAWK